MNSTNYFLRNYIRTLDGNSVVDVTNLNSDGNGSILLNRQNISPDLKWINELPYLVSSNKKGYIIENCVPCCKRCNWMKSDMNKEEFISHIKDIYEKHK